MENVKRYGQFINEELIGIEASYEPYDFANLYEEITKSYNRAVKILKSCKILKYVEVAEKYIDQLESKYNNMDTNLDKGYSKEFKKYVSERIQSLRKMLSSCYAGFNDDDVNENLNYGND